MDIELIVLTMSSKNRNYCVAGIDRLDGEWIRLVSNDEDIKGALRELHLRYEDGSWCNILDIIRVRTKGKKESKIQPENKEIDDNYYFVKLGQSTVEEVIRLHRPEREQFILGNKWNYITDKRVSNVGYSLTLVEVFNISIYQVANKEGLKRTKINFTYNDTDYENLSVTDQDYFCVQGQNLHRAYLVISLPEQAYNNKYYKFVAKIFKK